jgi:hypothetical protein
LWRSPYPDTTIGPGAPASGRALAESSFTGLINAFSSGELVFGVVLTARSHQAGRVNGLCHIVAASFAVGLEAAWNLMRGRHLEPTAELAGDEAA